MGGTVAGEASGTADIAEGACGIDKIGCIHALETIVAGRTVGTSLFAGLASPSCIVTIPSKRALSNTGGNCEIKIGRGLAGSTIGCVETGETVRAALGADHCRSIVEEVGGTGVKTGIVANCHEESGVAFEASCCFVVPAVYAGHVTARAVHGHIVVIVVFIA